MRLIRFVWCVLVIVVASQNLFAEQDMRTAEQKHFDEVVSTFNIIKGPVSVDVGGNAKFNLPAGFVFLNPDDTGKMMNLLHNPGNYSNSYYFGPENMSWFALFSYQDTGHVKDDEVIDADVVLDSIKKGTEEANKQRVANGWKPLNIIGWMYKPYYDPQTKRLDWAISAQEDNIQVVNYNTRILSRTGVTSATLIAAPANLNTAIGEFKNSIGGYSFIDGERYAEYKSGDKTAEYGLMALIAGGATAVAAKKGFFAVIGGFLVAFWKLIAAGFVALLVGVGKFFGRKERKE